MTADWCPVAGFPGYEVNSQGQVRSLDRIDNLGRPRRGRLLKPRDANQKGHLSVVLSHDGLRQTARVHRLVASAFIPNPLGYPLVRHLNGNPADNRAANLAWGDVAMNWADARRHGTARRAAGH
ncbi:NUMOD4 domain-containing protein [Protaetiibacter larvae]|uniref:NUMOD4 domain-containing protein n=1 Tax=Protaetiibacter larvae TaxID=2592654 RepID=A0A5C1YAW0_9MICO|nr:hypothetical protein FLP23_11435 [Protaetiibacter larvae]